jgi:hypothetical protein
LCCSRRCSKSQTDGVGMWHVAVEGGADGGLQLARPVAVEQAQQRGGDRAEIVAAFAGADQQGPAGRCRRGEAIGAAVTARGALVVDQGADMAGLLDLLALVVTAPVAGEDERAVRYYVADATTISL